ncbi:type I restriction endonuclease subunit R [Roseibium sediminicola]|uniref:Type I restriction enzyme endonuclease subunit n=1 Tax=Roseibium sediminicola TaxID=2933272 RepID=A0ABT0GSF1_9HYPH|nr:type I restriction endonuclease subunit R [Roseibium sp. CAU 1639]MCK7612363.1 type I restriction endonuclease subunit R [Roseibium sp. CAU 1639]
MNTDRDRLESEFVEDPAADLLRVLFDYRELLPGDVASMRDGPTDVLLTRRLETQLKTLNPWIDEDGIRRAIAAITRISAVDLIDANEKAYTALTYGITLPHTDSAGRRQDRSVRYFDFDKEDRNTFEFARQVTVKGPRQEIVPDIILYVNGIPLVVIECKSPALSDPIGEALRQFRRYEGREEFQGLGAPRLFEVSQLSLALARDVAKSGTTATPPRFWADWRDPYPMSSDALSSRLGRTPTPQDALLAGMLAPENLLDLVRNFIIFETIEGKRIKKIARYQQYVAVGRTIERIRFAPRPEKRGGVIHHTQGSGKSLTMVFLAIKLRRLPEAENPTLVIVTDRTELDGQITGQFQRAGFPNPVQAESGEHLRDLLSGGAGTTVLTTVHKFQSAVPKRTDVISEGENIFVMVDEAHRTQYGALAARMRAGLPHATMIAFTGTPIDKKDRATRRVFGDYIHRYLIHQAVKDEATVPIFYEMRDARMRVHGRELEADIRNAFPELSDEEIQKLKRGTRLQEKVAGAEQRVRMICQDILAHYCSTIEPNGFKAQIVTASRDVAVTYVETLRDLGAPECAVIMSTANNDSARLQRHHHSKREREDLVARFKRKNDPLKILVVCDMLLTGFDAPVEQVLYLDAPLREHTLLQAIARVNRTADGKKYGLIVDYWGDNRRISEALEMFSEDDGVLSAMRPASEKYQLLESRHRAAMRLFDNIDRTDEEACVLLLEQEDIRARFELDYQRFAEAMDMVLPDPKALEEPYASDLKWLSRVRAVARRTFSDERFDVRPYGAKVGDLIASHLQSEGVEQLLQPTDILDPAFLQSVAELHSEEAKAARIEHAIRHEIHVHREENPTAYSSLWEDLEELISRRRTDRVSAASQLARLDELASRSAELRRGSVGYHLSGTSGAILPLIDFAPDVDEATRQEIATHIATDLEEMAQVIDWQMKEDVQRQMRRKIKEHLRSAKADFSAMEASTAKIMDVARARLVK